MKHKTIIISEKSVDECIKSSKKYEEKLRNSIPYSLLSKANKNLTLKDKIILSISLLVFFGGFIYTIIYCLIGLLK